MQLIPVMQQTSKEQEIRKQENQFYLEEFILPFEVILQADNRWVKLAKIIPWDSIEIRYTSLLPSDHGQMAKPV